MENTFTRPAALLNLGCGQRFHPAWINLDLNPANASVRRWDVRWSLPFDDGSFDAVYHSHLLEHLHRAEALRFVRECHRVLRPGGVMRLAVPDLEGIARLYLEALDAAWSADAEALEMHRWLLMELYDQTTREVSGGAMLDYLEEGGGPFAWHRLGSDAEAIRKHLDLSPVPREPAPSWRERLIRWLLGEEYWLLQIGRFRRSGEVHQWMYDRVSLRTLLATAGFVDFRMVGPTESAIAGWHEYHLDAGPVGTARKPDSLFAEASRGAHIRA